MTVPIIFEWTGDAMVPLPRLAKLCDRQFVVHETYRLVVEDERSTASHRFYFASINEAWSNLSEVHAGRFFTPDDFRKHALIHTGYANPPQHFVCQSRAEAVRLAGHLARITGEYAEVSVDGTTVTRLTARSQSYRSMKRAEFEASKRAVLEYVARMIGVAPDELARNAGKAA